MKGWKESMELDDFLEPEVAVTAAVAAAVFSPGARKLLRRGLVYGTAGALIAGDAITSFTRRITGGARPAGEGEAPGQQEQPPQG
jgi:hypothetical protein